MTATYTILLSLSAFAFAYVGTALLVWLLPRLRIVDTPSERSNHVSQVPRGGGLAVIIPAIGFLVVGGTHAGPIVGALALLLVSFLDDKSGMSVKVRLGVQVFAVALALTDFHYGLVFQGLVPWWLDRILIGILWLWFINLYNFMDGIDEITSMQTLTMMAGLVLLTITEPSVKNLLAVDGAILGGAILGFWFFNRHPAKIFLGDSGSVPLGFLIGFLLLVLAAGGHWQAALILPAYYLCDATLTLARRLLAGKKIWEAHSEHAYQRAVRGGRRHDDVSRHVLALDMILVTLSVVSLLGGVAGWAALAAAYALSFTLMQYFTRPAKITSASAHA